MTTARCAPPPVPARRWLRPVSYPVCHHVQPRSPLPAGRAGPHAVHRLLRRSVCVCWAAIPRALCGIWGCRVPPAPCPRLYANLVALPPCAPPLPPCPDPLSPIASTPVRKGHAPAGGRPISVNPRALAATPLPTSISPGCRAFGPQARRPPACRPCTVPSPSASVCPPRPHTPLARHTLGCRCVRRRCGLVAPRLYARVHQLTACVCAADWTPLRRRCSRPPPRSPRPLTVGASSPHRTLSHCAHVSVSGIAAPAAAAVGAPAASPSSATITAPTVRVDWDEFNP